MLRNLSRSSSMSSQNPPPHLTQRPTFHTEKLWDYRQQRLQRQQPPTTSLLAQLNLIQNHWKGFTPLDAGKARYKTINDTWGPVSVGANRRNCSFKDLSCQRGILQSVDYSGSRFSSGTDFSQCYGAKADFSHCTLLSANFKHATLTGTNFGHARLDYANFESADLGPSDTGPSLFDEEEPKEPHISPGLRGVWLALMSRFRQPRQLHTCFNSTILAGAGFKNANLERADFRHADLTGTSFENANLQNADFRGANIVNTGFENANLQGAKFDISACIEQELQMPEPQVARLAMELAELSAVQGLDLNLHNLKTERQIQAIFEAKAAGQITQPQLEERFRHFYKKAEKLVQYRDLTPSEYLPFIFNNIHHQLYRSEEAQPGTMA